MSLALNEARVLLTGATGGLGAAIARALHERGASLLLSGRNVAALDALAAELGSRVESAPADLSDPGDVAELTAAAGGVDVLVSNAALPASGRLEGYTTEQLDRALHVNLRAPMELTRALLPGLLGRGRGHLVYVSSMAGKVAPQGAAIYNATKFGLRGFAFSLRQDLRRTDVGVSAVFPGFIRDAGMHAKSGVKLPPIVRMSSPEQVANAVVLGIEEDRAEIDVAPLPVRAGGWVAGAAPSLVAAINRALGADRVAAAYEEAQRQDR